MDIGYLIQLLNNKLAILASAKDQAFMSGDLDRMNAIDSETLGVQNTLAQLNLVQQITAAAVAANSTPSDVIASGLGTIQNTPVVPDSPTGVLTLYDLSTYASDPLYQQKISDILSVMPAMDTASEIDSYISNEAIGSPLTGAIILAASQQYAIDTRLLMSILELESNFGTAGVAVSTLNPGNVGNTGSSTRTYNSWQDGVAAVAQWLSLHMVLNPASVTDAAQASSTDVSTATTTPAATASVIPLDPSAYIDTTPVINNVPAVTPTPTSSSTATSTPDSTTTPDSTNSATSTPTSTPISTTTPNSTTTPDSTNSATSTPDIIINPATTSTSTPTTTPDSSATTTPSTASSTTSNMDMKIKKRKRISI